MAKGVAARHERKGPSTSKIAAAATFFSWFNPVRPMQVFLSRSGKFVALLGVGVIWTATAFSQGSRAASDQAWTNVQAMRNAVPAPANPGRASDLAARREAKAAAARELARAARDFYQTFPNHPAAAEAKKIEALAGLDGINGDDRPYENAVLATASSYRTNRANFVADRYEVARRMEEFEAGRASGGRHWLGSPLRSEQTMDRLRAEFGELPHVHGDYLALAESTSCDNAGDVALKILQMPTAPEVRVAAQRIYDRWRLIGTSIDFPLTASDGRISRLAAQRGTRTVLYFWSPARDPKGPAGLQPVRRSAPAGTKWVYIALGGAAPSAEDIRARGTPPGAYFVEPAGMNSPLMQQLSITQLPYVFVLDVDGMVTGFGRASDLPVLLTREPPRREGAP